MSILVRFPNSNVTKQQYDAVRSELEGGGHWPPDGCQLHVAFGPEDDIRVSEVWESAEKFRGFGETLGPSLERAGIQLAGEPEVFDDVHVVEKF
jgi:hypothetical protein